MMVVGRQPGVTQLPTDTIRGCPGDDQSIRLAASTNRVARPEMISLTYPRVWLTRRQRPYARFYLVWCLSFTLWLGGLSGGVRFL